VVVVVVNVSHQLHQPLLAVTLSQSYHRHPVTPTTSLSSSARALMIGLTKKKKPYGRPST